ncbi:MAG: IscS subfamily cysteine desulfurase [Idiomarina sp.]|nr:IscS subfamily cysteine desulfurase [Idiomarina sp.]MCL5051303.1 IscS subfamily cysteine desulfurase [Bacillota bacterium]
MNPLYFDYAATTPMDPRVAEKMAQHLTLDGVFGNPASRSHRYGWQAEEAVDEARGYIADLIGADPREIVFTSGATESNNLAIKGVAEYAAMHQDAQLTRNQIVTVKTEHKAVLDTCADLERRGFVVHYLDVGSDGLVQLDDLAKALNEHTLLVSVMQVNNETGVVQDIAAISRLCRSHNVLLHVDAAQSVGKMRVDVNDLDVDLMSISAHKMYGPKGIGALYVRRKPKVHLHAQIHGGGHERGMRSGTLATHQIVGFGEAARLADKILSAEHEQLVKLRQRFLTGLESVQGTRLNGHPQHSVPGIINVHFADVDGEMLLMSLKDIAVSTGSACNSASVDPSFVLTAMGLDREQAHSSVRFSIGRFTTQDDIDACLDILTKVLKQLRANPIW